MSTVLSRPQLEIADDRTLAGRAADGDVRAFEVLVRRYSSLMRAYAIRILGANQDADDIVQDAFITAWNSLDTLQDAGAVKSWLMRIVSHKSIDTIRLRKAHDDIDDYEPAAASGDTPEAQAVANSSEEALARALAALPVQQSRCWVLKEVALYSYDEIAAELQLPASTVRGLLSRARKNLMVQMEEWR